MSERRTERVSARGYLYIPRTRALLDQKNPSVRGPRTRRSAIGSVVRVARSGRAAGDLGVARRLRVSGAAGFSHLAIVAGGRGEDGR